MMNDGLVRSGFWLAIVLSLGASEGFGFFVVDGVTYFKSAPFTVGRSQKGSLNYESVQPAAALEEALLVALHQKQKDVETRIANTAATIKNIQPKAAIFGSDVKTELEARQRDLQTELEALKSLVDEDGKGLTEFFKRAYQLDVATDDLAADNSPLDWEKENLATQIVVRLHAQAFGHAEKLGLKNKPGTRPCGMQGDIDQRLANCRAVLPAEEFESETPRRDVWKVVQRTGANIKVWKVQVPLPNGQTYAGLWMTPLVSQSRYEYIANFCRMPPEGFPTVHRIFPSLLAIPKYRPEVAKQRDLQHAVGDHAVFTKIFNVHRVPDQGFESIHSRQSVEAEIARQRVRHPALFTQVSPGKPTHVWMGDLLAETNEYETTEKVKVMQKVEVGPVERTEGVVKTESPAPNSSRTDFKVDRYPDKRYEMREVLVEQPTTKRFKIHFRRAVNVTTGEVFGSATESGNEYDYPFAMVACVYSEIF